MMGGAVTETRASVRFPATPPKVRECLLYLREWLHGVVDDVGEVELVLAELLNNVAEHGYPADTGGDVSVTLEVEQGALRLEICDRGGVLPDFLMEHKTLPDPLDLPEGGFGWPLIHALTEDISYNRKDGVNQLQCRMPLSAGPEIGMTEAV